jgi:hypothetical protein
MNNIRTKIAILVSAVLLLSGCATIIAKNLKGYNQDWEINIIEMKSGPNKVNKTFVFTVRPSRGARFIWLTLQARNRSDKPQTIDLKKISLISGQVRAFPFNVMTDEPTQMPPESKLTVDPHQSAQRQIVFSFPTAIQPRFIRIPDFNDIPVE